MGEHNEEHFETFYPDEIYVYDRNKNRYMVFKGISSCEVSLSGWPYSRYEETSKGKLNAEFASGPEIHQITRDITEKEFENIMFGGDE